MRIFDFESTHYAADLKQIDFILSKRYGDGVNNFWISHGEQRYPTIAILAKGNVACVHYFPREGHPGYVSLGDLKSLGLEPGGETTFYVRPTAPIWAINEHVISFPDALNAVHEFAANPALPKSIQWFEL
jgi:hypothetical protein